MTRIVIVSHSHPHLRYGGGEVAAYRQFQHLVATGEDAHFVGCTIGPEDSARFFGAGQRVLSFSDRDHCLRGTGMDGFTMEHSSTQEEDRTLDFLLALAGDVYHFHHFWNIGAGTIRRLRARLPGARMICTLHEMTAICANHGQMTKTSGELCHAASEIACASCLSRPPADFMLRRARMHEMLATFDVLLSPSVFLADRFSGWGIPRDRIQVIENGLDNVAPLPSQTEATLRARSRRFAFFGQATPTKGLDVLVRAAQAIDGRDSEPLVPVTLDVFGVTQAAFAAMWPGMTPPPWLRFRGRYRPQDCVAIMQDYGWIIIPSVWWENSPVVIQEARAAGTPMIASDIGGMAEKTAGWGLSFPVGDAEALASVMRAVSDRPDLLAAHVSRITPPLDMAGFTAAWRAACQI